MLELLALRKGMTLNKEMFLSHLYGGMDEPEAKIIDVFICKLRKKLASASGGKDYIETIWGRGYAMREHSEAAVSITFAPGKRWIASRNRLARFDPDHWAESLACCSANSR
jgi:two-component system cell cycle response regulator CtrA